MTCLRLVEFTSDVTIFGSGSVCLAVYICTYGGFLSVWVCYPLAWTARLALSVPCVVEVLEED
jgi:hypothetical protein